MFVVIVFTLLFVIFLTKKYFDDLKYSDYYKIKGPKPVPLLGNALIFGFGSTPKDVFETQLRLASEYGDFFRMSIGPNKIVVLGNPDDIEVILRSTKHIRKSANYDFFINWLGNGLVNSSGNYWRKHRKILTPTFHFKSIQDYTTFMAKNLNILNEILHKKCSLPTEDDQQQKVININHYVKLFALDTICDSAMRYEIKAQSQPDSAYVKALKEYLEIHIIRFFSMFLRIPVIFNLSSLSKQQNSHADCMKSLTNDVINSRKKERENSKVETTKNEFDERPTRSFLDLLLDKQDEENMLTDKEIREEVSTFMFAGHDTVSSSISFCLYEIAKHADLQQRLVEESWLVMTKSKDVEVNCTNIASLKLLDCVVKECMRIYTTVPFIERDLEEEVILNGLRIPAGTTVQIMMYTLHRNEKYFPDPEKFDPERFSTENCKTRHPYAYIPFSAGPRNCIGYKYGLLLTKSTVINILRNFKMSLPEDSKYKPELFNSAILESTNGVNLCLESRK